MIIVIFFITRKNFRTQLIVGTISTYKSRLSQNVCIHSNISIFTSFIFIYLPSDFTYYIYLIHHLSINDSRSGAWFSYPAFSAISAVDFWVWWFISKFFYVFMLLLFFSHVYIRSYMSFSPSQSGWVSNSLTLHLFGLHPFLNALTLEFHLNDCPLVQWSASCFSSLDIMVELLVFGYVFFSFFSFFLLLLFFFLNKKLNKIETPLNPIELSMILQLLS